MENDFIIQFHEDLDRWINSQLHNQSGKLLWRDIDVSKAIFNYLWYSHLAFRDRYIDAMHRGNSQYFNNISVRIPLSNKSNADDILNDLTYHSWRDILSQYKDSILLYADNLRHIQYLLPLILHLGKSSQKILLLTRCTELPKELQNDSIVILNFQPIITKAIITSGLVKIDPQLPIFIHTLFCYIHWLSPKLMICCDGCQTQYQLAAIYCRQSHIPSLCLQFGWPGYIHSGFRDMPYSHYLTWGKEFSHILKLFSSNTEFLSLGRLGSIDAKGSHDAITFFMQAPIFVSSYEYYKRFIHLIERIALKYPSKRIFIRSHPEFKFDDNILNLNYKYQNIELDFNNNVESTYKETHISVSHYSSCLVESIAFGCKPLMFNPTYGFDYQLLPDSHIAHDEREFMLKLEHIIKKGNSLDISNSITDSGLNCIRNITTFINTLI
ncbi:MAG: hypothetical protein K2H63_06970 [Paramuribaculum sp.]|nr:hypothetical protein [Paramuribaculum sp.]